MAPCYFTYMNNESGIAFLSISTVQRENLSSKSDQPLKSSKALKLL